MLRRGPGEDLTLPLVLGYYTLTVGEVQRATVPPEVTRRLLLYPLSAIIIGRLARDIRVKGRGIGEILLDDAHRRALQVNAQAGAVLVVVDAKDPHAFRFYERHGYRPMIVSVPGGREWPCRMYIRMKELRAAFAEDP